MPATRRLPNRWRFKPYPDLVTEFVRRDIKIPQGAASASDNLRRILHEDDQRQALVIESTQSQQNKSQAESSVQDTGSPAQLSRSVAVSKSSVRGVGFKTVKPLKSASSATVPLAQPSKPNVSDTGGPPAKSLALLDTGKLPAQSIKRKSKVSDTGETPAKSLALLDTGNVPATGDITRSRHDTPYNSTALDTRRSTSCVTDLRLAHFMDAVMGTSNIYSKAADFCTAIDIIGVPELAKFLDGTLFRNPKARHIDEHDLYTDVAALEDIDGDLFANDPGLYLDVVTRPNVPHASNPFILRLYAGLGEILRARMRGHGQFLADNAIANAITGTNQAASPIYWYLPSQGWQHHFVTFPFDTEKYDQLSRSLDAKVFHSFIECVELYLMVRFETLPHMLLSPFLPVGVKPRPDVQGLNVATNLNMNTAHEILRSVLANTHDQTLDPQYFAKMTLVPSGKSMYRETDWPKPLPSNCLTGFVGPIQDLPANATYIVNLPQGSSSYSSDSSYLPLRRGQLLHNGMFSARFKMSEQLNDANGFKQILPPLPPRFDRRTKPYPRKNLWDCPVEECQKPCAQFQDVKNHWHWRHSHLPEPDWIEVEKAHYRKMKAVRSAESIAKGGKGKHKGDHNLCPNERCVWSVRGFKTRLALSHHIQNEHPDQQDVVPKLLFGRQGSK